MNRKHLIFLFLFSLIIFLTIDKQKPNIISSHKSGLYLKPFKLSLTYNSKYRLHYTFDGSNPTNKSKIFKNHILITGNESFDSLSFINTTIPDSITNFGWRKPEGIQDKATIIKYAGFYNGILQTEIKTLSFFIETHLYNTVFPNTKKNKILNKFNNKWLNSLIPKDSIIITKYKLPIVSISTNKINLFSKENGLFIAGDNFKASEINSGNYFQRGKDFERLVHLQYFNQYGGLDFDLDLGMRIHGGITRRNPQKSLKFYARKEYGKENINLPFLSKRQVNRFTLESLQETGGGQALIEDVVAQNIVKEIGLEQQNFQAVIVFINGEYWGIHTLRDKIDENYLAYKFNLHKDSFDIIDGNPSINYEIIHGDNSEYIDLMSFITENDISEDINYNFIGSKIDINNFIDYFSVEIFFANQDWPIHNIKIWKNKNNGKWRWILYDLDGGFTNKINYSFNMFNRISNTENCGSCGNTPEATLLFRSMMKNTKFFDKFNLRYNEIVRQYMKPNRTLNIVDSITEIYHHNMQNHINRWGYPWTLKHHWKRDVEKNIKEFLINREVHTLKNLKNYNQIK